jgi:hypothetical protein
VFRVVGVLILSGFANMFRYFDRDSIMRFFTSVGDLTFWCRSGSGSPDPYLWLMDPDPIPFSMTLRM